MYNYMIFKVNICLTFNIQIQILYAMWLVNRFPHIACIMVPGEHTDMVFEYYNCLQMRSQFFLSSAINQIFKKPLYISKINIHNTR